MKLYLNAYFVILKKSSQEDQNNTLIPCFVIQLRIHGVLEIQTKKDSPFLLQIAKSS